MKCVHTVSEQESKGGWRYKKWWPLWDLSYSSALWLCIIVRGDIIVIWLLSLLHICTVIIIIINKNKNIAYDCAGSLYVTANGGCHFEIYHIWVIKQVHFSRKIGCRSVVFVLFPVFWIAFLSSVSWFHSAPSKFIFTLHVTISV